MPQPLKQHKSQEKKQHNTQTSILLKPKRSKHPPHPPQPNITPLVTLHQTPGKKSKSPYRHTHSNPIPIHPSLPTHPSPPNHLSILKPTETVEQTSPLEFALDINYGRHYHSRPRQATRPVTVISSLPFLAFCTCSRMELESGLKLTTLPFLVAVGMRTMRASAIGLCLGLFAGAVGDWGLRFG